MSEIDNLIAGLDRAMNEKQALAFQFSPANSDAYREAHENVLRLQRNLARLRGEEFCEELSFEFLWQTGAPLPQLLHNEQRTFLAYYLATAKASWPFATVEMISPEETEDPIAVVEFIHCYGAKLAHPNDEVLHGHPLWGKGLDYYSPFVVVNSSWINQLETINKVHPSHSSERWKELNHYLFTFHDMTFECLARDFKVTLVNGTMKEVVSAFCARMFD